MGVIRDSSADSCRDHKVRNAPSTGDHELNKRELRETFGVVEDEVEGIRLGQTVGVLLEKTWAALAARTTGPTGAALVAGTGAEVVGDAGTHTDPVVGGTVSNSGRFRYSTSPAGWERIGSAVGSDNAAAAQTARTGAEAARDVAITQSRLVDKTVIGPVEPLASGTPSTPSAIFVRWLPDKAPVDSYIDAIETGCGPAGATFLIVVGRPVSNDTQMEFVSITPFTASPGRTTKSGFGLLWPVGCVVGLVHLTGEWFYFDGAAPGGAIAWFSEGVPSAGSPVAISTSTTVHMRWRVTRVADTRYRAEAGFALAHEVSGRLGQTSTLGWSNPVATGDLTSANYSLLVRGDTTARRLIRRLTLATSGVSSILLRGVTLGGTEGSPTGTAVAGRTKTLQVSDGVNPLEPAFWLEPGEDLVIEGGGVRYVAQGNTGVPSFVAAGAIGTNTALTVNPHRFQASVEVATGLTATLGSGGWQEILPNDARLRVSDAPPIKERSARRLRFERPLDDGQGYQHCAPGARVGLMSTSSRVLFDVYFNALVERDDARNYVAKIVVDGVVQTTGIVNTAGPNTPQRVGHVLDLGAPAMRKVELIWPYGDGMDLERIGLDPNVGVGQTDARPAKRIVTCTDSIGHGFSATSVTDTWVWKLGELQAAEVINGGYGGRTAIATDGLWAGDLAASAGANATIIFVQGVNNAILQSSVAGYKAQVAGFITNARSRAPLARILCVGPFWCQGIEGNAIPLDSYRTAVGEAVAESTAGNVFYRNGKPAMTNDASTLNPDLVHPNDTGMGQIATWLNGQINGL